ncbi:peptide deformylase [Frankia tisae]|uniref:peptide deformylase n=1 Tax=Frankia tisae TaxID=2950104 RepID=UPI0021C11CFA|nr:peptide deformylase [Frankia tisae]
MAVLSIRTVGDPVLRTPTALVTTFDAALARLVDDMIDTMYDAPGVGLAAPQVGVGLRVFVFDVDYDPHDVAVPRVPRVVVNPVLELAADGEHQHGLEGCLSVPGRHFPTTRALRASVRGVDVTGAGVEYAGEGLLARCFQHEVDHLDGTLYLDRLTGEDRKAAVQALREPPPSPEQVRAAGEELRALRRADQ